jgi:hypothetical protein
MSQKRKTEKNVGEGGRKGKLEGVAASVLLSEVDGCRRYVGEEGGSPSFTRAARSLYLQPLTKLLQQGARHRALREESGVPIHGGRKTLLIFFLQEKAAEITKQNEEKRGKPKPEEQEGMPQHQHCPPAKRRRDGNPDYHEEKKKDVAYHFGRYCYKLLLFLGTSSKMREGGR